MKKILPIILAAIIIAGVGCFFGGMKYGQSKIAGGFPKGNFPQGGAFGNGTSTRTRGDMGGMVSGEILSSDNSSITVKLQTGGSKIVFYSDVTQISKTTDGSAADLKEGETVMVSGTSNSDGSVSAKTIQIRPALQNQP